MKANLLLLIIVLGILMAGCLGMSESTITNSGMLGTGTSYKHGTASESLVQVDGDLIATVKTGYINVEVPSGTLEQKYAELRRILDKNSATVSYVSFTEYSDEKIYHITVKITPRSFEALLTDMKTLGEVQNIETNVEDVTQAYRDLEMRIKNKEIELARLYELYNKTDNVEQLLKVEQEVSRVEYEIESLKQQKKYYDERIEKSTVTIRLFEKKPTLETHLVNPLSDILSIFFTAFSLGTTVLIGLIGFFLPLAIVGGGIIFVVNLLRRKKKVDLTQV